MRRRLLLRSIFGISIAALAGFFAALILHAYLRSDTGILDGLREIYTKDVLRRTWSSSRPLDTSLNSSVFFVLLKYLVNVPGGMIASGLLVLSIISCYITKRKKISIKHDVILLVLSFFTSISWFVLAKGHSYVHPFINYILWYMAFIPTALYVFIKQRIIITIPEREKREKFLTKIKTLLQKILFLE